MRKFTFTLLTYTFLFLNIGVKAQCPEGNLILHSQADVDTYATMYPNCTKIDGYVKIGGAFITDFSDISDVSALQSLTTVGGNLLLVYNASLTNLNGLDQVKFVGGNVHIFDNLTLTNLQSLSQLKTVDGSFKVSGNPGLKDLRGMQELIEVGGDVTISQNTALTTLKSLEKLTSVGGFFSILNNPALTHIGELRQLESVGQNLSITQNAALLNLQGLEGLDEIGGDFNILQNVALNDLGDLRPMMPISGNMRIYHNTNLSDCAAQAICQHILVGGAVEIGGNGLGCSTVTEIETSCTLTLPTELVSFDAKSTKKGIELTWQTATETDNEGFEIQRSKDASNWNTIGWQASQGNSTARRIYTFTDTNPIVGVSYYRLIQRDLDARTKPSNIVEAAFYTDIITVHPNPVNDVLQITVMDDQAINQVIVYDTSGRVAMEGTPDTRTLDVSALSAGTYMVAIVVGENTIYKKIMVK